MLDTTLSYKIKFKDQFNETELAKGLYIAIIHATRIPPHIGLVADGNYCSLSVKGQDINTPVSALVKNSIIRKIPTIFVKIKPHPTFSSTYLREHFITNVQLFPRVDIGVATCLSPIVMFFEEVYSIPMKEVNYLYELLPALDSNGLIESASGFFIDNINYRLPVYTNTEIDKGIKEVREEFNFSTKKTRS